MRERSYYGATSRSVLEVFFSTYSGRSRRAVVVAVVVDAQVAAAS